MKTFLLSLLLCTCVPALLPAQDAQTLIERTIDAVGGAEALLQLEDVQYVHHRPDGSSSLERYRFSKEISYCRVRSEDGHVREEFYNGATTAVLLDGQLVTDPLEKDRARRQRRLNFYWLAMVHKLDAPGTEHAYAGTDTLDGVAYQLLDVTFAEGSEQGGDRYRLFIHPETYLVDRYLYAEDAAGGLAPTLTVVEYDRFADGVRLPVASRSHPARDWSGVPAADGEWRLSSREKFRFHNGFSPETIRQ